MSQTATVDVVSTKLSEIMPLANLPALTNTLKASDIPSVETLAPDRQVRVQNFKREIDFNNVNTLLTYSSEDQRKLNEVLDELLEGITADDIGTAGELVVTLAKKVKDLGLPKLKKEAEGKDWLALHLGSWPLVGPYVSSMRRLYLMKGEVRTYLNNIIDDGIRNVAMLKAQISRFDHLYDETENNLYVTQDRLLAGQLAILDARAMFDERRLALGESRDPVAVAKLKELAERINTFETRILRMSVGFTDGVLRIPQIRMQQQTSEIGISNTINMIDFDIPNLKSAVISLAASYKNRLVNQTAKDVQSLSRELRGMATEAMGNAYVESKQTQGDGEADLQSFVDVANKILVFLEQGTKLDQENRKARENTIRQLSVVRNNFVLAVRESAITSIS